MGNSKSKTIRDNKIDDDIENLFAQKTMMDHKRKKNLQKTIKANMKATLKGSSNVKESVLVPEGESENEWISIHILHFLNTTEKIFDISLQFCNKISCPKMTAGQKYTFLWADGDKTKAVNVPACKYVALLFDWVREQTNDTNLFPLDESAEFPRNFRKRVNEIYRRLFRVYAHIYHTHLEQMKEKGSEAHLNSCFKHFVIFSNQFGLLDERNFDPLKSLVIRIIKEEN